MRLYIYIILSLCSCLWASAQIAVPPQYIHGDSIVMWSPDGSDFRSLGLHVDPTLTSRNYSATNVSTKERKRIDDYWTNEVCGQMDIVGGFPSDKKRCCPPNVSKSAQVAAYKFLDDPQAKYFDAVERILMNGAMRGVLQLGGGEKKHALAQTLCDAAGWVYATSERNVYLNLFVNSTARIVTDSLRMIVDQMTSLPHDNRVKIRISGLPRGKYPFTLKIRIPDWAVGRNGYSQRFAFVEQGKQTFPIYINGREENVLTENGYMVIHRKWNSGDEVFFDLPMDIRVLRLKEGTGQMRGVVAFQRGPWMYSAEGVPPSTYCVVLRSPQIDENLTAGGNVRLRIDAYSTTDVSVDAPTPDATLYAVPFVERGGWVWWPE